LAEKISAIRKATTGTEARIISGAVRGAEGAALPRYFAAARCYFTGLRHTAQLFCGAQRQHLKARLVSGSGCGMPEGIALIRTWARRLGTNRKFGIENKKRGLGAAFLFFSSNSIIASSNG
jgi:hypothetical protein